MSVLKPNNTLFTHGKKLILRYVESPAKSSQATDNKEVQNRMMALGLHFSDTSVFKGMLVDLQSNQRTTPVKEAITAIDASFPALQKHLLNALAKQFCELNNSVFSWHISAWRYVLDVSVQFAAAEGAPLCLNIEMTARPCTSMIAERADSMLGLKTICTTSVRYALSHEGVIAVA
jgi:hypothetical protein